MLDALSFFDFVKFSPGSRKFRCDLGLESREQLPRVKLISAEGEKPVHPAILLLIGALSSRSRAHRRVNLTGAVNASYLQGMAQPVRHRHFEVPAGSSTARS